MKKSPFRYIVLYLPFILALLISDEAHVSYFVAWLGSFLIFYVSFSGGLKPLPNEFEIIAQLMRPIFLLHIIFAGYMSCTSIFYYINTLGYEYFDFKGRNYYLSADIFKSIAQCQRYYVLGHAAFVHGILLTMKYPIQKKFVVYAPSMSNLLLGISIISFPLGIILAKVSVLSQFSVQLVGLSFVAGTIGLAFSIREKKKGNFYFALGLFAINLLSSLISGFKEPIIICVLLLGVFLLPVYGKKIIPLFGIALLVLFFALPTFIGTFRSLSGSGVGIIEARDKSIDAVLEGNSENLQENNWAFLTYRISEIDMFIKYTNSTPYYVPYYKLELVLNAIQVIIPRYFWPSKPNVENLVMDRVYKAGVVDERSAVSAKPAYIVDCFLSYGAVGIWIGLFAYGFFCQWISQKAEELFGGYFLGSAVMFGGLFQILWRGNSFEFIVSAVVWSFVTMLICFYILKAKNIIEPIE